jgi:hypothetical protein
LDSIVFSREIEVDGKRVKVHERRCLLPEQGIWQIRVNDESVPETWLIKRQPGGEWTLVDKRFGHTDSYAVSSDGKWFSVGRTPTAPPGEDLSVHTVFSMDKSATWSIACPDGYVIVDNRMSADDFAESWRDSRPLGRAKSGVMPLSPDGRWLPFFRVRELIVSDPNGKPWKTGYPESVELGLLDLNSGTESVLFQGSPEGHVQHSFKVNMQEWLWVNWLEINAEALIGRMPDHYPWLPIVQTPRTSQPRYTAQAPVLVWAPGGEMLAVLYDGSIKFYIHNPNAARQYREQFVDRNAYQGMGDFLPYRGVDVSLFRIENMDFLDRKTLIAWGEYGLFRIEIEKAPHIITGD